MCVTIRYELDTDSYCLLNISLKYYIAAAAAAACGVRVFVFNSLFFFPLFA